MGTPFTVPQGFTTVEAAELVKFDHKGDVLEGILIRAETVRATVDGQPAKWLELFFSTGRGVKKCRPGFDLREKINGSHIGKHLWIKYVGDDESKGKDGNAMKIFAVGVKPSPNAGGDPNDPDDPGITDEDIPF